jgi:hypothetical protein
MAEEFTRKTLTIKLTTLFLLQVSTFSLEFTKSLLTQLTNLKDGDIMKKQTPSSGLAVTGELHDIFEAFLSRKTIT